MNTKINLTKTQRSWYMAKKEPELVSLAGSGYLAIEGKGDPNEKLYGDKLQALYSVAYALKFLYKARGNDFVVARLEGQWWYDEKKFGTPGLSEAPLLIPRSEWSYRNLIRMPEFVKPAEIPGIISEVIAKKKLPYLDEVWYYELPDSEYIQILHTGPFSKEPESLQKMFDFMSQLNLDRNGNHQEIYLSDFRKTPAEKLRTILREPVRSKKG